MMMATEKYEQEKRAMKAPQLRKQPEIEEIEEEEDTSPGSDQSDVTITAGGESSKPEEGSSESTSPDLKSSSDQPNGQNHISPKNKQLTRSQALCEECASPPPDRWTSTASTGSTDSSSSGVGSKSVTSGYCSGSGRLEKDGSQTGSEAGTLSSLSRDSSVDSPYKDSTGIDLEEFIRKTLNKTSKDRSMLLKLETDLSRFIKEPKHHYLKFPQMSSYDRMLVHRIAAFFGLDHNVDQTGKCVIVNKTANTRIPEFSFVDNVYTSDAKPKMVLKRGGRSLEERESKGLSKESLAMTRAKSLEERQQKYEEARSRIFTEEEEEEEEQPTGYSREDAPNVGIGGKKIQRPYSLESSYNPDSSTPKKIIMPKANSFGGTGNFTQSYIKAPVRGSSLSKADSMNIGTSSLVSPIARDVSLVQSAPCGFSESSSLSGGSNASGQIHSPNSADSMNIGTSSLVSPIARDVSLVQSPSCGFSDSSSLSGGSNSSGQIHSPNSADSMNIGTSSLVSPIARDVSLVQSPSCGFSDSSSLSGGSNSSGQIHSPNSADSMNIGTSSLVSPIARDVSLVQSPSCGFSDSSSLSGGSNSSGQIHSPNSADSMNIGTSSLVSPIARDVSLVQSPSCGFSDSSSLSGGSNSSGQIHSPNSADSMNIGTSSLVSPIARDVSLVQSPPCGFSDSSSLSGGSNASGQIHSPNSAGQFHLQSPKPKVYWVASDPQTIPPGSLVINPHTGQPYFNTDGTPYRYMPGQPLPQPTASYSPSPQPVYQFSQEESPSTSELCQPVSVIRLNSQSPSDGSGEPTSMTGATGPHPSQSVVVSSQGLNLPQGYAQLQQQNVYYPASQTLSGQPVRYISYSSPAPVGQVPQGVSVEGQPGGQPYPVGVGPYPSHYVQGYGYPSVHYTGVSQGSDGSASYSQPGTYQTTSQSESGPVQVPGPGYSAYSIQYSQGMAMPYPSGTAGQPTVYYSVHSQSSQPVGYSTYPAPTLYQGTSSPSHAINAPHFHPVGYNLGQAMSYSQAPTSATGPQPVNSQYISYPSYQHRAPTPQVVPFPNVHSSMPQNPPQSFQTLFRPGMQFGVQMQQQQQQQQPIQVSASPMPGAVAPSQHGHVTVSAKGLASYQDNQVPKIETMIDNHKEVVSGGAGATALVTCHPRQPVPINRPPHMTSGDMRLLGQPQMRAQVAPAVQFTTPQQQPPPAQVTQSQPHHQSLSSYQQQQQPQRVVVESGLTPKPQRVRKSRSREGQISNHNSSTDLTETGNTLEVYDLVSNLRQSDAEKLLKELTSLGARLHFVKKDVKKGSDSNQGDKNNLMISDYAKVLAVFPDKSSALSLLQNHKNNAYKLRVVNESIDGKE